MSDRWLTLTEAAERVGRTERTLWRWRRQGLVRFWLGRVNEAKLLEADRLARSRMGRPRCGTSVSTNRQEPAS